MRFVARKEEKADCGVVSPFYSLLPAGYSLPLRGSSQVMAFQSPDSNRLKAASCNSRQINQGVKRLTHFEKRPGWRKGEPRPCVAFLFPAAYWLFPAFERGLSQVMAFQSPDSNRLKAGTCNSRRINQGVKRLTYFEKSQGGGKANQRRRLAFLFPTAYSLPLRGLPQLISYLSFQSKGLEGRSLKHLKNQSGSQKADLGGREEGYSR